MNGEVIDMVGNNIKCIFCDLDGTLFDIGEKVINISMKNFNAVVNWMKSDKFFVVTTGRDKTTHQELSEVFKHDIDLIGSNGGVIISNGIEVYQNLIPKDKINLVISELEKYTNDLDFLITLENMSVIVNSKKESHYSNRIKNRITLLPDEYFKSSNSGGYKVSTLIKNPNKTEAICNELKIALNGKLEVVMSSFRNIEIMNKDVSKWTGILKYCHMKNINLNEIVVIGDEDNDFDMIKNAKNSFAIRSGSQHVKNEATYIVDSVAEMIENYLGGKSNYD